MCFCLSICVVVCFFSFPPCWLASRNTPTHRRKKDTRTLLAWCLVHLNLMQATSLQNRHNQLPTPPSSLLPILALSLCKTKTKQKKTHTHTHTNMIFIFFSPGTPSAERKQDAHHPPKYSLSPSFNMISKSVSHFHSTPKKKSRPPLPVWAGFRWVL